MNALLLVGGGARAAYQAGVLRSMARAFPDLQFPILTGVSAGAINVAMLANSTASFSQTTERLEALWANLTIDQVFRTKFGSLGTQMFRSMIRFAAGRIRRLPPMREMVDTAPLRALLNRELASPDGVLGGIEANLRSGRLSSVGITTTKYPTGKSTTWAQGLDVEPWQRADRRGVPTTLTVEHIMASSALPLVFPAAQLEDGWYGDGGIRLTAPLSSAVNLGADRIIAISTLSEPARIETTAPFDNYPTPASILGVLLASVFLDMLDTDAVKMLELNQLIADNPRSKEFGLRPIDVLVIRPSEDLGNLAHEFESELPSAMRRVFQALGSKQSNRSDVLATLLFQPRYLRRVMEIGEKDGLQRRDELAAFLGLEVSPKLSTHPRPGKVNGHHVNDVATGTSVHAATRT
jgi:NTE family protein